MSNEMWTAFEQYQSFADAKGHGESWKRMTTKWTPSAIRAAADAATDAAWAAENAADAAWTAADAADAAVANAAAEGATTDAAAYAADAAWDATRAADGSAASAWAAADAADAAARAAENAADAADAAAAAARSQAISCFGWTGDAAEPAKADAARYEARAIERITRAIKEAKT